MSTLKKCASFDPSIILGGYLTEIIASMLKETCPKLLQLHTSSISTDAENSTYISISGGTGRSNLSILLMAHSAERGRFILTGPLYERWCRGRKTKLQRDLLSRRDTSHVSNLTAQSCVLSVFLYMEMPRGGWAPPNCWERNAARVSEGVILA